MNVSALRTMTEGGMLEIDALDPAVKEAPTQEDPQTQRFRMWCDRLRDFCAFSQHIGMTQRQCTLPEMASQTYDVAVLPASDAFRAWFEEASLLLAQAWPKAVAQTPNSVGKAQAFVGMARWMACAAMLDLPKAAQAIHAACPRAWTTLLPLDSFKIGQCPALGASHAKHLEVSPVWFAWQFSSHRCLDWMSGLFLKGMGDAVIGHASQPGHSKDERSPGERTSIPITLVTGVQSNQFSWYCDNATLTRLVGLCLHTPDGLETMQNVAMRLIVNKGIWSEGAPRIEAFRDAGLYEHQPTLSAQAACLGGFPSLLERVLPLLQLSDFERDTLSQAMQAHQPGVDQRDVAVLKLLLQAKETAGLDAARDLFWHTAWRSSPTISSLFDKQCDRMLVPLMDAGIVEPHVASPGGSTPMEMARSFNSPMVDVMTSWIARRSAYALLEEMDAPIPGAQP